ncbi:hypothetical protein [Iodobacter ciconiae]|uniref:Probable fimbrial chaperone EcpB n=1 Tax=Iodobacter ciconiae TaxID=2496266 RepID=A0A3S8ZP43_9NEIS|nr:hypothetical protein [Iodobacter ciconiae]AZN35179.1 hypothetical protein EJO50_00955 [Iodobacter ciconiae]
MKKLICIFILFVFSKNVFAISLDSFYSYLPSDKNTISIDVKNPDASAAHLFKIEVYPIESPYKMDKIADGNSNAADLLFTPEKAIVPADGSVKIKFVYNGPKDDKERYYAIKWTDVRIDRANKAVTEKAASAVQRVTLATTLIILPREEKFDYALNKSMIKNTGNSMFKFFFDGKCNKKGKIVPCSDAGPLLPGRSYSFEKFDFVQFPMVGIWRGNKVINADRNDEK